MIDFAQLRQTVASWYIVLLPALLILTNIGERTYQDLIVVALVIYALWKREYVSHRMIYALWALWAFYTAWSIFTDYLGSGELNLRWLIRTELILLLPVFLAWVCRSNFQDMLLRGFKVALVLGAGVSVYQVFGLGWERAEGQENALIYAACISTYGLFVIHESIVRHDKAAGIWLLLTLVSVALSGSRGVFISLSFALVLLAFFIPRKAIVESLVLPFILALVIIGITAADKIAERFSAEVQETAPIEEQIGSRIEDIANKNFGAPSLKPEKATKGHEQSVEPAQPDLKPEFKTSSGYRIAYLLGGWKVFLEHPLTGVGSKNDTLHVGQALGLGSSLTVYSHVHNAFLQDLVSGGIVKLAALLAIISMPLVYLSRQRRRKEFSLMLVITANCAAFGATNMLFELTTITFLYTLILSYAFGHLDLQRHLRAFRAPVRP